MNLKISNQRHGIRNPESGIRDTEYKGVKSYKNLDAWKLARELTKLVYDWTDEYPKTEQYGLVKQLRNAAVSITSNIAEGFGRYHWADRRKFYFIARASCDEVESQLTISKRV